MTYVEYWLLVNAITEPLPIFYLKSEFDEYGVRRIWDFSRNTLLDAFTNLLCRNEIIVFDGRNDTTFPSRSELTFYLDSENKEYCDDGWISPTYRLTELGGRIWEDLSKPQWDLFAHGLPEWHSHTTKNMMGTWTVIGTSRDSVNNYMHRLTNSHPTTVIEGSKLWGTLTDYPLTYWKTGKKVVRHTCRVIYDCNKILPSITDSQHEEHHRHAWYSIPEEFTSLQK